MSPGARAGPGGITPRALRSIQGPSIQGATGTLGRCRGPVQEVTALPPASSGRVQLGRRRGLPSRCDARPSGDSRRVAQSRPGGDEGQGPQEDAFAPPDHVRAERAGFRVEGRSAREPRGDEQHRPSRADEARHDPPAGPERGGLAVGGPAGSRSRTPGRVIGAGDFASGVAPAQARLLRIVSIPKPRPTSTR